MSIYKVINNYYDDFLLYLKKENENNNGLENFFNNITDDKKKEIIINLTNMILKFDLIYNNEANYLASNIKQQKWFIAIYVLTLIIIFIIIIIIFISAIRYNKRLGKEFKDHIKTLFTFIIIFEVILLFFIVMLVNVVSQLRLSNGQLQLLKTNFYNYSRYIFKGTSHDENSLIYFFTFLGYWRKSDKNGSNKFYLLLQNDSSFRDILSSTIKYIPNSNITSNNTTSVTGSGTTNLNKAAGEALNTGLNSLLTNTDTTIQEQVSQQTSNPLLVQIYNALSNDIKTSLIKFYNKGNGFFDVKKIMLLDNPTALLKESRYIMDFYYSISLKKYNPPTAYDIETQKNENDNIIYKEVLYPMISLINTVNINNIKPSNVDLQNIIAQNKNDTNFNDSLTRLLNAFFYLIIFVYPIYINISDIDINFPNNKILMYMPNNLDTSSTSLAITKDFLDAIIIAFSTIYNKKYQKYFTKDTIETFTDQELDAAQEKEPIPSLNKTIPLSNKIIEQQNQKQTSLFPTNTNIQNINLPKSNNISTEEYITNETYDETYNISNNSKLISDELNSNITSKIQSELVTNEEIKNEIKAEIKSEKISISENNNIDNQHFIIEIFNDITPLFQELYYNLFIYLNGYSFPFDHDYIVNEIRLFVNNKILSLLPDNYKTKIIELIYNIIIKKIQKDFDIFKIKKGYFVDLVSTKLLPYKDIDIIEYQSYILNSLLDINNDYDVYTKDIIDMTTDIQKKILIKRQLMHDINNGDQFVTDENFITIINNITYNDLIQGLNVVFYQDIISNFYKKISESVNMSDKNLQNIYYQKWKNIKVFKIITIMVIIILITSLIKYLIKLSDEKIYIPEVIRECDRLGINRQYSVSMVNAIIKSIIPLILLLLIIAMLVSYYKKIKSKLEFNIEIIENNSNDLSKQLVDFYEYLIKLDTQFSPVEKEQSINLITKFTKEQKIQIFKHVKIIVDKFDKCNYIVEASGRMPFPYSEVFINVLVLIVCIAVIFIILIQFNPAKCVRDIKYLNKLIEELAVTRNLNEFTIRLMSLSICHYENIDAISIVIKSIFGVFVFMFLLYYSVLVFSSANQFKNGLYNSKYFEDGQCYR